MLKVLKVEIENMNNVGCTNGNYPNMSIYLNNRDIVQSITCGCGNGCSDTSRIVKTGMIFESMSDLDDYLKL